MKQADSGPSDACNAHESRAYSHSWAATASAKPSLHSGRTSAEGQLALELLSSKSAVAAGPSILHCVVQKSSWYQKLGQSFNAPGIIRFGQLATVDSHTGSPLKLCLCMHLTRACATGKRISSPSPPVRPKHQLCQLVSTEAGRL